MKVAAPTFYCILNVEKSKVNQVIDRFLFESYQKWQREHTFSWKTILLKNRRSFIVPFMTRCVPNFKLIKSVHFRPHFLLSITCTNGAGQSRIKSIFSKSHEKARFTNKIIAQHTNFHGVISHFSADCLAGFRFSVLWQLFYAANPH